MDSIYEQFKNPENAYRSKPFWAWNGALEEQELRRQIDVMKEMGFGGFFMHSRTGLQTQYLGKEWFSLVNACTEAAVEKGMEPWIYDEDRWPSGAAGGIATEQPRYRRKYLTLSLEKRIINRENILAVFCGRVDGYCLQGGYRQISPDEYDIDCLAEDVYLVFRIHTMACQSVYNGFADLDRLDPEATALFLQVTHQQYKAKCADTFRDIVGVFTDEPHRGMVFSDFSDPGQERNWSIPWTPSLPQEFEKCWGYSLIEKLPELFLQLNGNRVAKIKWQYMELLLQMFTDNFLQPIQAWARENGKKITGHLLNEDSLMSQTVPCGSMMRCYHYFDEPGIDCLTENRFVPWAVKALESVARQTGKQWKLSELFGATGWQMSFKDYKYLGDWQTVLGINVRCPHLSWYTMKGEAKRDYPGSFLHQATWYREYAQLEEYFARLAEIVSHGTPVCDTLVIHPVESLWCSIHPGWANALDAAEPELQKMEKQFENLFHWLMQTHVDFDYGDEGLMAKNAVVEAKDGDCGLRMGKMIYRTIVVAGCRTIRDTTFSLLSEFCRHGGQLLFIGKPPEYVACEKTDACKHLATQAQRIPMDKKAVLEWFQDRQSQICVETAEAKKDLYLQLRTTKDGWFAVLWNKSRSRAWQYLQLRVPEGYQVQRWDCFTAERSELDVVFGKVCVDLEPGQELVLRLQKEREKLPAYQQHLAGKTALLGQPKSYCLDEDNVLVLDKGDLIVDGCLLAQELEVLELDRILRRHLGMEQRGGEMIQPWAREKTDTIYKRITLRYSVPVEKLPTGPVTLAAEVLPEMEMRINGREVILENSDCLWVDQCYTVYVLPKDVWQLGRNTLEITALYSQGEGLESMFLLGAFGVWLRDGVYCIGALPPKIRNGNLVKQGLPFYSGKITYIYDLPEHGTFCLRLPAIGGSCAVVNCNGMEHMIPWTWHTPVWENVLAEEIRIQVVLNRRNTFGPLHKFPLKQPYIAPDSFVCAEAEQYALYPTGLLKKPELIYF